MGAGSGRGREKSREDWRRRAVGEDIDLDIVDRGGASGSAVVWCKSIFQWL